MTKEIKNILACLLLMFASSAHATTVTYILDQSNSLENNVDYLSVMLSDDTEGQLDFWIETLPALNDIAGENFGIQSFAFNFLDIYPVAMEHEEIPWHERNREREEIPWNERNRGREEIPWRERGRPSEDSHSDIDFILPDGWRVQFNKGMSEAGKFDVRLMGTGNSRLDPLHFSILGLTIDDVAGEFAAHVAGFVLPGCEREGESRECGHERISSAFFYGGRLVESPPEIPVPAAVWLFGSGLLGLIGVARRRA